MNGIEVTENIEAALEENKRGLSIIYWIILSVLVMGVVIVIVGAYKDKSNLMILGGALKTIVIPLLYFAKKVRADIAAIRLFELTHNKAESFKESAEALELWISYITGVHKQK